MPAFRTIIGMCVGDGGGFKAAISIWAIAEEAVLVIRVDHSGIVHAEREVVVPLGTARIEEILICG